MRLGRNCLQKHCDELVYSPVVSMEYTLHKLLVYIVSSKLPTQNLIWSFKLSEPQINVTMVTHTNHCGHQ